MQSTSDDKLSQVASVTPFVAVSKSWESGNAGAECKREDKIVTEHEQGRNELECAALDFCKSAFFFVVLQLAALRALPLDVLRSLRGIPS
jgi:hypothetical protein